MAVLIELCIIDIQCIFCICEFPCVHVYVVSYSLQTDFNTKIFGSVSSDIQLCPKAVHPHVVGEGRSQESPCGFPVCQKQVLIQPVLRGWPAPSRPRNCPTAAGRQHPRDPPSALPLRTISPGPTPSWGRRWLASPRGRGQWMTLRFNWIKNSHLNFFPRHNTAKSLMYVYILCDSVFIQPKCYWFCLSILYDDFLFVHYFVRGTVYVHYLVSVWFCLWLWYWFLLNSTPDYHHQNRK